MRDNGVTQPVYYPHRIETRGAPQRNEKEFDRLAKLNEKKSVREPEEEIETKETNFAGRTTRKFYTGGEKMRDASVQQGGNEQKWKKKGEREHKQQNFL